MAFLNCFFVAGDSGVNGYFSGPESRVKLLPAAGLFQPQLLQDARLVGLVNQGAVSQAELSFVRLLGQDMALVSVLSLDLSTAGELKALLGTGFGLHFRHYLVC